jgi:hypothetical protein
LRERPAASSLAEAASLLGLQPADIVKTLVVKKSDDTYLFALIPGDLAISWPKLRALVGVNKLRLPEPELALAATGYERDDRADRQHQRLAGVRGRVDRGAAYRDGCRGTRLQPVRRRRRPHPCVRRDGRRHLPAGVGS